MSYLENRDSSVFLVPSLVFSFLMCFGFFWLVDYKTNQTNQLTTQYFYLNTSLEENYFTNLLTDSHSGNLNNIKLGRDNVIKFIYQKQIRRKSTTIPFPIPVPNFLIKQIQIGG